MNILISSIDNELVNLIEQTEEHELVGTVVNIFNKVINIETSQPPSLITLANVQVVRAPFMLKVKDMDKFDYLKQTVTLGDTVKFNKKGHVSLNGDQLIFRSSTRWQSLVPPMGENEIHLVGLQHQVNSFLKDQGESGGILNAYLTKTLSIDECSGFKSIYDSYFRQLIQQLAEQFDGENLKKFIGLGIGLTPSGDDFIVGVLAALYHYDTRNMFLKKIKSQISPDFIDGKTTRVSKYMLQFALNGKFNDSLLDLLNGRLTSSQSLEKVNSIGSTSGTDMLSGVGFALEQLRREYKRRDKLEYKGND